LFVTNTRFSSLFKGLRYEFVTITAPMRQKKHVIGPNYAQLLTLFSI
jgi:hypothetical protein